MSEAALLSNFWIPPTSLLVLATALPTLVLPPILALLVLVKELDLLSFFTLWTPFCFHTIMLCTLV
jgi:hypothetical protein